MRMCEWRREPEREVIPMQWVQMVDKEDLLYVGDQSTALLRVFNWPRVEMQGGVV
jgi:hypothetical protein